MAGRRLLSVASSGTLVIQLLLVGLSGCADDDHKEATEAGATEAGVTEAGVTEAGATDGGSSGAMWGSDQYPLPSGAEVVTATELYALSLEGALSEVKPDFLATEGAARAKKQAADEAYIGDFLAKHPNLVTRLAEPPLDDGVTKRADGNYEFTMTNNEGKEQTIVTYGLPIRNGIIAAMLRKGSTKENQLKIFNTLYATAPQECRDVLPDPKTIGSLSAEEILAANNKMGQCWWDTKLAEKQGRDLSANPPPGYVSDPDQYAGAPGGTPDAHNGDATGDVCDHNPDSLWAKMNWANKMADTSVKNQANRGTCAAFGIVGAVENLVARGGEYVNLSEEALYAFGRVGDSSPPDGVRTNEFVDQLVASGYLIPYEQKWVYNPSPYRKTCDSYSEPGDYNVCEVGEYNWGYRWSCDNSNKPLEYSGPACSNTAHQAKLVCEGSGAQYHCYWWTPSGSVGFKVADSIEWLNAACLSNSACWTYVSQALWSGWSAVVSIDVWKYWKKMPKSGFPTVPPDSPQYLGGHAMEISGWVFNYELPAGIPPSEGAGYYIVKNSWGSCWGDGGYAYLSDAWMIHNVNSIMGVAAQPTGFNTPPTVQIVSPADGSHHDYGGLLGSIHFVAAPDDPEDGPGGCTVKWYSGSMDNFVGEGTEIDIPFDSPGTHIVVAAVEDSEFGHAKTSIAVYLDNNPPTATIITPANGSQIYRGATVMLNGSGYDLNEPTFGCSSLVWTSSVAADPFPAYGCSTSVVFTTNGPRVLTLTATDSVGGTGTDQTSITVVDPPLNKPPVVTITSPAAGQAYDEAIQIPLTADVFDPDGGTNITYRWTVQQTGSPETDIGTSKSMTWRYLDSYACPCATPTVTIRLYATDNDGTGSDQVSFTVTCPPC